MRLNNCIDNVGWSMTTVTTSAGGISLRLNLLPRLFCLEFFRLPQVDVNGTTRYRRWFCYLLLWIFQLPSALLRAKTTTLVMALPLRVAV